MLERTRHARIDLYIPIRGDAFNMYLVCTIMTHKKTIFLQFFIYFQVSNTLTFTYEHYACK